MDAMGIWSLKSTVQQQPKPVYTSNIFKRTEKKICVQKYEGDQSHRIHVWYIYLHLVGFYGFHAGKYTTHGSYGNQCETCSSFFLVWAIWAVESSMLATCMVGLMVETSHPLNRIIGEMQKSQDISGSLGLLFQAKRCVYLNYSCYLVKYDVSYN